MNDKKYMDRGAEIRDESYQKAVKHSANEIPLDASRIEIVYTPLDLLMACQSPDDESI